MSEQTPSEYLRGLAQGKADMAGEISLLNAVIRQRDAALRLVMIGGNHLATHINPAGPAWQAEADAGLTHYGAGMTFDVWCCWRAIMRAREMTDGLVRLDGALA